MSVMDIELGNRASAEKFLSGYGPTFGEDGRPNYFFYNKYATQVLHLVADSWDDRYFITEIEVYSVSRSYGKKHFQLKDVAFFKTGNGLFIGYKQSAAGLLSGFAIGVNDPGGKNQVRSGRVEELFGEPDERTVEGDNAALVYKLNGIGIAGLDEPADYEADFEFRKNKLKKLRISIAARPKSPGAEKSP